MKDLDGKISTYVEVKVALKDWAKTKDSFTTDEATTELLKRSGRVTLNNNKVAQFLRGADSHEYHEGMKKWIKVRK